MAENIDQEIHSRNIKKSAEVLADLYIELSSDDDSLILTNGNTGVEHPNRELFIDLISDDDSVILINEDLGVEDPNRELIIDLSSDDDSLILINETIGAEDPNRELIIDLSSDDDSLILINEDNDCQTYSQNESIEKIKSKMFARYFENSKYITIDREEMEDMLMMEVVQYLSHFSDSAKLRQRCKFLENEQERLTTFINTLKEQVEDVKLIISKFVEAKVNNEPWTRNVIPPKMTQSIGVQVCRCGSVSDKVTEELLRTPVHFPVLAPTKTVSSTVSRNKKTRDGKDGVSENTKKMSTKMRRTSTDDYQAGQSCSSNVKIARKTQRVVKLKNKSDRNRKQASKNEPTKPSAKNIKNCKGPKLSQKRDIEEVVDSTGKDEAPLTKKLQQGNGSTQNEIIKTNVRTSSVGEGSLAMSSASLSSVQITPEIALIEPRRPSTEFISPRQLDPLNRGIELATSQERLPKLPYQPKYAPDIVRPPKPILRIGKSNDSGIMLKWTFSPNNMNKMDSIQCYQLYAYQTKSFRNVSGGRKSWKKVGDVKALSLPMACFLTHFLDGSKYHFIVRALDKKNRMGEFSSPGSVLLHLGKETE